ncbi:Golgi phosphoprotein 3 GPP34 [Stackebrandtia albiflava]|uniref:Golgi phosphoprotein 3 GPP34 n=1 Tax=Stackebrandtia albiflava TaxID=406432 RepID=A0A562VDD6_9ACTN|nr:GPP34 family phosphoprotein [Stackebrandtia albiflava]TWJ15894.1 Golgi phosphoprotein 3 GPP34 [Stackebrandtia albiflava]
MVILAEELLLLAYRDDTGRNQVSHLELGLAGALLLELAVAERIDVVDKRVTVVDSTPTGDPLLDDALARIGADRPRKAQFWVQKLSKRIVATVLDRLVARGTLRHHPDRVLGLFPFQRYLPVPGDRVESDARDRLAHVVATGMARDAHDAGLASLVYALQMERKVFPDRRRKEVRAALKAAGDGAWASQATRQAVEAAQAAVMAAITAAIAASAAATGSSG